MSTNPPWDVEDGGETPPWEVDDTAAPAQKASNPLFAPLRGAKIEAKAPYWPYIGGPKSGLASDFEGFAKEIPAMALRGGNLLRNLAQGETPWSPKAAAERAALEERLNELLGTAKTGEKEARTGRLLARMVPGVVAGAATGGMSVPAQALIQGGVQGLQSLSEGAPPEEALTSAALGGGGAALAPVANWATSFLKAPFAKSVDQQALQAFERLGVKPPASAVTRSPVVQQAEALASKFPGGQELTERSLAAQEGIPEAAREAILKAGNPDAVAAGTNIAQEVLGSDAQAASREAMLAGEEQAFGQAQRAERQKTAQGLFNPKQADRAPQEMAGGLQGRLDAFRQAKDALWNKVNLSDIDVNPEETLKRIEGLLRKGDLPPSDLAALRSLRDSLSPRKMLDLGGGVMVPQEGASALSSKFTAAMGPDQRLTTVPKSGNEILSQLRGLRERVPYGQGQGVFASPALRKALAGDLRRELGDVVTKKNPKMGATFTAANKFYEKGVEPFKSDWAKKVFKLVKAGNVSKVADEVVKPGTAPEEIAAIMQQTGAGDAIRANVMQRIRSRAKGDPAKIGKAIEDWKNLGFILTKDQMDQLQTLAKPLQEFVPPGQAIGPKTAGELIGGGPLGTPVRGAFQSGSPNKVVGLIVRPDSSPQEIAAAMKAAGPAAPEIQANAMKRILGIGDKERLTPEEVFRRLQSWGGPERLGTFLEKDQVQAVMDVIRASRAMGKAGRITGGSQTAFLGNMVALAIQFPRHPLSTLKTLATAVPVSTFMGKEAGQKWLTTGFAPATRPGQLTRFAGISNARLKAMAEEDERRRRYEELLAQPLGQQ